MKSLLDRVVALVDGAHIDPNVEYDRRCDYLLGELARAVSQSVKADAQVAAVPYDVEQTNLARLARQLAPPL